MAAGGGGAVFEVPYSHLQFFLISMLAPLTCREPSAPSVLARL